MVYEVYISREDYIINNRDIVKKYRKRERWLSLYKEEEEDRMMRMK